MFTSTLLGGFIVLLRYNWYPAKILIGDTGTLTLGTGIIVALIIGNMDRIALGAFGLHFINFVMFFMYLKTQQTTKIASIDTDNNIVAPCPYTVYWIIPYYFKVSEKRNVQVILLIHALLLVIAILLSLAAFSP
jgi:UDP-N-acetylglucosamine--dolichyl-phosphate N-acetylglucosaminephosphotransferase